jgi:hypothetical protein
LDDGVRQAAEADGLLAGERGKNVVELIEINVEVLHLNYY